MKIATINSRNAFFLLGFLAVVGMAWAIGFDTIADNVVQTGWWFFGIIGMWLPIYLVNTWSLNLIIRDENPDNRTVPFLHIFKINISGFALKAATPLGFIGGDPYKIVELKRFFGVEKATSSVLLYTMTHISAQFMFWALSIVAAALFLPMPNTWSTMLLVSFLCFVIVLWLLWRGYRKGMTVSFFDILSKVPLLKRKVVPFCQKYSEKFIQIDHQISHLYYHRKKTFLMTLFLEFLARVLNCLEVYIILRSASVEVTLIQSVVIYAFMSLFTNIFFFSPMQIGTREGGFLLAFTALGLSGSLGIYVSLITRVRELIWIGIGVLLMKIKSSFIPVALLNKSQSGNL
jgi:uncharacterized membrane protein YbhN (UPF0104 family)